MTTKLVHNNDKVVMRKTTSARFRHMCDGAGGVVVPSSLSRASRYGRLRLDIMIAALTVAVEALSLSSLVVLQTRFM